MTVEDWECLVYSFPHPLLLNFRQWNPPAPHLHSLQIRVREKKKKEKYFKYVCSESLSLLPTCEMFSTFGCIERRVPLVLFPVLLTRNFRQSQRSLWKIVSRLERDRQDVLVCAQRKTKNRFTCSWNLFNWFHAASCYLISRPSLAATVHTVEARVQTTILTREQLLIWKTGEIEAWGGGVGDGGIRFSAPYRILSFPFLFSSSANAHVHQPFSWSK